MTFPGGPPGGGGGAKKNSPPAGGIFFRPTLSPPFSPPVWGRRPVGKAASKNFFPPLPGNPNEKLDETNYKANPY